MKGRQAHAETALQLASACAHTPSWPSEDTMFHSAQVALAHFDEEFSLKELMAEEL